MADELLISFPGGLKFYGHEAADVRYTVERETFRGWFESSGVRRNKSPRPLAHGDFPGPSFREGRVTSWEGLAFFKSAAEQERGAAQLAGLLDGGGGPMTVQGADGVTWADMELDDFPTFIPLVYGKVSRYRLRVYSPDPWRFGETRVFGPAYSPNASVVPFHRGNTSAVPRVRVSGNLPNGYTLTYGARQFIVTTALNGTDEIDMSTGFVWRGGVMLRGGVSRRQLFTIPRGVPGTPIVLTSTGGTGQVRVEVDDTYL